MAVAVRTAIPMLKKIEKAMIRIIRSVCIIFTAENAEIAEKNLINYF